jgi:hypothetical protein
MISSYPKNIHDRQSHYIIIHQIITKEIRSSLTKAVNRSGEYIPRQFAHLLSCSEYQRRHLVARVIFRGWVVPFAMLAHLMLLTDKF